MYTGDPAYDHQLRRPSRNRSSVVSMSRRRGLAAVAILTIGMNTGCGDGASGGAKPGSSSAAEDVTIEDCAAPFGAVVQATGRVTNRQGAKGDYHITIAYDNGETAGADVLGLHGGESEAWQTGGAVATTAGDTCSIREVRFVRTGPPRTRDDDGAPNRSDFLPIVAKLEDGLRSGDFTALCATVSKEATSNAALPVGLPCKIDDNGRGILSDTPAPLHWSAIQTAVRAGARGEACPDTADQSKSSGRPELQPRSLDVKYATAKGPHFVRIHAWRDPDGSVATIGTSPFRVGESASFVPSC